MWFTSRDSSTLFFYTFTSISTSYTFSVSASSSKQFTFVGYKLGNEFTANMEALGSNKVMFKNGEMPLGFSDSISNDNTFQSGSFVLAKSNTSGAWFGKTATSLNPFTGSVPFDYFTNTKFVNPPSSSFNSLEL